MSRHCAVRTLWTASFLALSTLLPINGGLTRAAAAELASASPSRIDPGALLAASRKLEFADTRQAYTLAAQAVEQSRLTRDPQGEMAAVLQVGKMARFLNDYPRALAAATEGLSLATASGNEAMKGNFHLLLGYVKWNQSELPAAIASLLAAEKISRAEKDVPLQIAVQSTLGLVDARNDNLPASLTHLETACQLAEQTKDPQLSSVLNNLGSHYLGLKDYPKAREYYERALPLARPTGNQRLIAFLLVNLGQIAAETGDPTAANRQLSEALEISEQYQIRRGTADVYYLRGSLERRLGHFDLSRTLLDQSLGIAQTLKNPDLFAIIYAEYVATEEASGRYREALDYARKLADQKEFIRGEKSRQQAAQLTAQYDAETRSQQIKLLRRDRELDQADLKLKDAELSRAHTLYSALALALVLGGLTASALASRQRARARYASLALAETRAAKEQVEEADANKARLLTIAAQNLHESEARFRNAFDLSPLGIALVGLDGSWVRVNPALCHLLGYSERELLATDFQSISHPDDLSEDLECVAKLLKGEIETYQLEKRYFHKRGHAVWTRLDVSLIRDADTHEPKTFISQVQDITARRHDEEQLHGAKEEAERANSAKSEFLSRMSHELRTPLNAILGFGQLLEIQDLGSQSNQSVGQILTASRHLLGLINEVLDISTIESGSFALALEPIPAHDMVLGVTELVLPLANQADVSVTARVESGCGILADPRRLKQVLLNLLSNAIKYNRPHGEVTASCRVNGERVRIEVTDTGPGIAAGDLETIFVPFSRLPGALSVAGTGLGLSLSKVLTEAMQGNLGVESEVGRGSTFWIEFALMAHEAPWEPPPLPFDPVAAGFFQPENPSGMTVLYIEDTLTNLELVQQLLAGSEGIRLLSALDGRSGLEMAARHLPDLILLDMHLPDMTGSEVLRRLRIDPALANVPVIIVSADIATDQIAKMEAMGIYRYITKPFDLIDFRNAINEALRACPVA